VWQISIKFAFYLVILICTQKVDHDFRLDYLDQLQERLKEKERIKEQWRSIIDSFRDGFMLVNKKFRIFYKNKIVH